jgi:hypothetical protein
MEAVHVLLGTEAVEYLLFDGLPKRGRQRRLHQDAVAGGVLVERRDTIQHVGGAHRGRHPMDGDVQTGVATHAFLVAYVDLGSGVVADQHDVQRRTATGACDECLDARRQFGANGGGGCDAVELAGTHGPSVYAEALGRPPSRSLLRPPHEALTLASSHLMMRTLDSLAVPAPEEKVR